MRPNSLIRIGLISDTHMPERCAALPASLFEAFRGVDLILHAGDLGELWVLDRLAEIAPVIAVHGNDDTPAARRELPLQQIIALSGQRILLWHSHYHSSATDRAHRGGLWPPKLARLARRARRAGANILVFGHLHVPLVRRWRGTLLINPGALASGTFFTRQVLRTAALLSLGPGDACSVRHIDLDAPGQPYAPAIDWDADIQAAVDAFQDSLVSADLRADISRLHHEVYHDPRAFGAAVLPLCRPCWESHKPCVTRAELLAQVQADTNLSPEERAHAQAILSERMSR